MQIASFILSILGAVTGVVALVWQVIAWKRSGPVVTVTAHQAFPAFGDSLGEPLTQVTARNSGRSPVTITAWGLRLPNGHTLVAVKRVPPSDSLPYRLEPGASGSWYMETTGLAATCRERGADYADLTAYVDLASGSTVDAKSKGIQLGAGFPWSDGASTSAHD